MLLRELYEAPNKTAVMAFGRMNPPTIGHAKLVDVVKSKPGDPFIFLSQSQKPKTDPLPFVEKLRYAKFFFPNVTIGSGDVKTIIGALQKIESLGYKNLIYVAGSDRVQNFKELINKYNGKDYVFDNIDVVSAGERDPDAEGAEGMSASKMRQAAADNNFELFSQGVPQKELAGEMFAAVKKGMGVNESLISEQAAPQKIKPIPMPTPPPVPTGPDGTADDGSVVGTTPLGNRSVQNDAGTFFFDKAGKILQWHPPYIRGLEQIYDYRTNQITVNYKTDFGDVEAGTSAKYDMQGNKIKDSDSATVSTGNADVGVGPNNSVDMAYKISDLLSIHISGQSQNDPKLMQDIKAQAKSATSARSSKPLIDLANLATSKGVSVVFKSPADQNPIPYNQGMQMLQSMSG